jgi:prevent-host-death family protein
LKTATVRDLRNRYSDLLEWLAAGEEIIITQRGKRIARLVPERDVVPAVDWSKSAALRADRTGETMLSAEQSAELIKEAGGRW